MTDYTNLPDSLFQVGKPGIGSIFQKMRDNLAATSEGSPGAPKVNGKALDMFLGTFSGTGSGGEDTLADITGLGSVGLLMVNCTAQNTLLNGGVLGYRTSTDGGASLSDITVLIDASDPATEYRTTVIDVSGGINFITFRLDAASSSEVTGSVEVLVIGRDGA